MIVNRCFGCMEETTSNPCPHCGYFHQEQNAQGYALQPGTILHGKYLIGKVLGQGGFGITYIGWDLALAKKVAIKEYFPSAYVSRDAERTMNLQWYHTEQAQEAQNAGQEMFLKEARKMNKVASIPQVVHVQDMFKDNCTSYIVMNYIHGETLAKRIARTGPMSWPEVQNLLLPIADVMQTVHEAGLIHRDLSPDNLMIQPDGTVKVLDLGAAKDMNLHSGASSMQVAKGGFSPMEQYVMRGNSGPWTDVYSLAATMYYALTGVVPPSAIERMDKDTLCWNLPQFQNVPAPVVTLLQKAMAVQIKDRVRSLRTFADGLRKSSSKKSWKKFVGIAAAMVVLIGGVFAGINGASDPEPSLSAPPAETEPSSAATTEPPQEQNEPWADHVLMSTVIPSQYEYDAELAPVFNSRIARHQIVSVTFLDSLDTMNSQAWDVSQNRDGSVMAWTEPNGTVSTWTDGEYVDSDAYDLYIAAENGINGKNCANLFNGFENVSSIDFGNAFHTDYAESMENMFNNCYCLETLDVSELKTDLVRSMNSMFTGCPFTQLDLHHFDTSNVEDMENMFYNCNDLLALDLGNFDTSKVTDMSDMFCLTSSMTELNISSFNTSSVTDMSFMFSFVNATELDLSHFDTSKVTTMAYMFSNCKSLKTLDTQGFDTSRVTSMLGTFNNCNSLETVLGLTDWDTSSVTSYDDFLNEGVTIDGEPWINMFQ